MRISVTIDDQLLAEAEQRAARRRCEVGDIIDDALRRRFATNAFEPNPRPLPTFGVHGERVLVDVDERDAIAELLGDNRAWRG